MEWSGDEKLRELSDQSLREQANRLVRLLALSIHEGASETFWFYFPHYTEGKQQFGIVHADLTPRPGYLALAAMGRLMADAKPVGRMKSEDKDFTGYLFRARPDGKERIVLIAWTKGAPMKLPLKASVSAVFDTIGRAHNDGETSLAVCDAPIFATFPAESKEQIDLEPAPTLPPMSEGKPSPVVLQATWPEEKSTAPAVDWLQSCYHIGSDGPQRIPVYVYNFGEARAEGRLTIRGPRDWRLALPGHVAVEPMGRAELGLECDLRGAPSFTLGTVGIQGDFGPAGRCVLSLRLLPELPAAPKSVRNLPHAMAVDRWKISTGSGARVKVSASPDGLTVEFERGGAAGRWFELSLNLRAEERPAAGEIVLTAPIDVVEGEAKLAIGFVEESGKAFSVSYPKKRGQGEPGVALGHAMTPSWSTEPERAVDPAAIRSIRIRCDEAKSNRLRLMVKKIGWATY